MSWYLQAWRRAGDFNGRSRRREYWTFVLANVAVSFALSFVDVAVGLTAGMWGLLGTIFGLAVLVPALAVLVRRLHDTGRSGFWAFLLLVPILGPLVLIFFAVQEGTRGENPYGPDPKGSVAVA